MRASDKHVCIVLNEDGIVLGRVRVKAFEGDPDTVVEQAMRSGPPTIRPDIFIHGVVPRMHNRRVGSYVVTTALGHFIGILYREDAERVLAEAAAPSVKEKPQPVA